MRIQNLEKVGVEYRKLLEEYCLAVAKHFKSRLVSICVYGSVATGKTTSESDVDVLLAIEGLPIDVGSRLRETSHLRARLRERKASKRLRERGRCSLISEVMFTPAELRDHPPILLDLVDEGVILYDRADFLSGVLEAIRRRLKELGARKVVTKDKGHYWVLKPDIEPGEVVEI